MIAASSSAIDRGSDARRLISAGKGRSKSELAGSVFAEGPQHIIVITEIRHILVIDEQRVKAPCGKQLYIGNASQHYWLIGVHDIGGQSNLACRILAERPDRQVAL